MPGEEQPGEDVDGEVVSEYLGDVRGADLGDILRGRGGCPVNDLG